MHKYYLRDLIKINNGTDYRHLNGGNIPVYGSGGFMTSVDKCLHEGTAILLPRKGSLNNIMFVNGKFWTVDTMYWATVNNKIANAYYLYNLLNLLNLSGVKSGSTLPSMTSEAYYNLPVNLPDMDTQNKIASMLHIINAQIDLNNKINTELEATAKDLYKYWFMQFDFPDKDKRPYKSSGGKMVYNEILKREIPEGWTVDTLGSICNLYQPETISEKDCEPNGKYYVYGSNGIIGKYNKKNHDDSEIVISCRGDCGNIIRTMPNVWITGNAMVVHPKSNISQEFIYFTLQNAGINRIITGSVQGQITRKNLEPVKIVMPPIALLEQYEKQICGNVNIRIQNKIETEVLQQLRDFLLPMLMNGQVSVS